MNIVFTDAATLGNDMDLSCFNEYGKVLTYADSTQEQAAQRLKCADIAIVNKTPINMDTVGSAQNLKLVCVTATGTDNLDKEYLDSRGIKWQNAAGYSTQTVAQHTFALLFYLWERMRYYDDFVKSGNYAKSWRFTHFESYFHDMEKKTWGIIGLGTIGKRVADIASAFGCNVIYYSTTGKNNAAGYHRVDFKTLLAQSDIVSVHAPLNAATRGLMDAGAFSAMKRDAIFLNLGRGPIVDEAALADALNGGAIAAAGLDVLSKEPPDADNPLLKIKDSSRLVITPHIAWASVEARRRLLNITFLQVRDFVAGNL